MEDKDLCGEVTRTGGDGTSPLSLRGLLAAVAAGWALRSALTAALAIAGGCAHTSISRNDTECGNFSSWDTGVGIIHVPAGQYATYASACGAERFSRIVANQRTAIVAGAHAAATGGGRDVIARRQIARTQKAIGLYRGSDEAEEISGLKQEIDALMNGIASAEGGSR
ncbi:hypothetical protein HY634_00845 [Candidatus Uhrbacteria bacterium]|nr:hypothetical protein [Candidatus Uhrbacteria bacterium]